MSSKQQKQDKPNENQMSTLATQIDKSRNQDVKNEDARTQNLENLGSLGSGVGGTGDEPQGTEGKQYEAQIGGDGVIISSQKPIKNAQACTQAGSNPQTQIIKYYEQTFAPESFSIHSSELIQQNKEKTSNNYDKQEVQIQVGVSFIDEPEKIISSAKKERILLIVDDYSKFVDRQRELISVHKIIYDNVFVEIERKKMQHYAWHATLKEYFNGYGNICRQFYQKCQKVHKEGEVQQHNKYLNIVLELQDGFDNLAGFKRETGEKYVKMGEFVTNKSLKELDEAYNKYVLDLCVAQGKYNEKKIKCVKNEDQYKKQAGKVQRMFGRARESKMKEGDDFFVQICRFLGAERALHESLLEWGQQVILLKKSLIDLTENCVVDLQLILNSFKNESNTLYGIHNQKFQKMIKSRKQIEDDCIFANLINLENRDHVKHIIENQIHKEIVEITDQIFAKFVELPHLRKNIKQCRQLLPKLVVKKFDTKQPNTQLISTISSNLVFYNKQTFEMMEQINLKNIVSVLPIGDGVLELEEKVKGIIFNSKKNVKIEFQNSDRAEELICFFGEGVQEQ